jgi:protein-tyrosine kinase
MDKLERALEKARQQRNAAAPRLIEKSAVSPASASSKVSVSEAQFERNRIVAYRTRSAEADLFRILRTQVLQAMNKSNFKTLAITSPNYGEGKTTIALNLAVSIALDLKQTVLLADLDLRKPGIHSYLGLNPEHGLTDYLLHDTPLPDCLLRLPFDRLTALPAGKSLENSSETLASPKMAALAQELKSRYPDRFIIYDMPPILAQDDPIAFLPHVDAVLLVVRDGVTRADEIKRCLGALEHANVVGTVLNNRL